MSDNLTRGVSRRTAAQNPAADLGYDYHWGRIAGAALLLVLLIALLVYLLLRGLDDETVELPKNDSATSLTAEPTSAERRLPADPPLTAASAVTEPERPADAETSSPDAPAASPESDVSAPSSSPEQAAERELPEPPQPEAAADESPGADDTAATSGPVRPPETSAPEPETVTTNTATPAAAAAGLANFAVTTSSPSVARARFAAAVRDNEPVGDAAAITANEQGLVRVIFFTEIRDRKGTPLVYRWLRDGKRVATVHTGAWNNAWRSYSSKFITPAQRGSWRVELVDDKGAILAAGTFDYAP